jgi:hypothetical protein
MHDAALDQLEEQIEAVAESPGREDRGVHLGHLEQLLRLEDAMAEAVRRTDEHLGHDHDDEGEGHPVPQADEGLRKGLEQGDLEQDAGGDAPMTFAARRRFLRAFMTPYATLNRITSAAPNVATRILVSSPTPKITRNRGNMAEAGVERKKSTTNSSAR